MTPDYVAVRAHWTVEQALRHVRRRGRDSETINRVYVVDRDWHLIDDIALRKLILAEPDQAVEDVMDHQFVSVSASEDRERARSEERRVGEEWRAGEGPECVKEWQLGTEG